VKLLIAAGADVNYYSSGSAPGTTSSFATPLQWSIFPADLDIMKDLIEAKADVNAKSSSGPALGTAVRRGLLKMTELLISAKADVNAVHNGQPLLHSAAQHDTHYQDMDHVILEFERYSSFRDVGDNVGVINALIAAKADVLVKDSLDFTAVMCAAIWDNAEAIPALIAGGANIEDVYSEKKVTALMLAIERKNVAVFKALIAAGADVNAKSTTGLTPLIYATSTKQVEMVKILIAAGADVNSRSDDGTAMDVVVRAGPKEIHEVLSQAGAMTWLNTVDEIESYKEAIRNRKFGKSSLDEIISQGSDETKEIALQVAVLLLDTAAVTALVAAGVSPSAKHGGMTPLHVATRLGRKDLVAEFLAVNPDTSVKNHVGKTALQSAAGKKDRDIVALFVAKAKEQKK
jgi:serine/threonine-protein phosphatase 6 regulatory ankyrin repeat subunit B